MKTFALMSLLVASAMAGAIVEESLVEPIPQYTQSQNTATGEYGYSYSGGPSAKTEFRATDGTTTGSYSYVDAHGILQTVNYIADEFGFRVAGTNVPTDGVTPLDAPDVAAVKAAHLAEHSRQALNALGHRKKRGIYSSPIFAAPAAVEVRHAVPAVTTTSFTQAVPVATSHQSRFQIHNGAKIIEQVATPVIAPVAAPIATVHSAPLLSAHAATPFIGSHAPLLFRKKRGALLAEAPIAVAAPPTTAKILDEFATRNALPLAAPAAIAAPAAFAAAPAAVEVRSALPAIATTSYTSTVPIATSHQSRFQIHNGARIIEQTSYPVVAPAAIPAPIAPAYPAAFPGHFAPALPAAPFAPGFGFGSEAVIPDGDAITVESA